ncbi:MAG: hypothetical protein OXC68_11840 [Aestuariivita sp.]|nr:hypothetical protein [Aestuariivita sp.]
MNAPYYDLGTYSLPISTTDSVAQEWFDRGLKWTYGYNHHEAITCFRNVLEYDPNCAMAWWGIAYASGPNYNLPWHVLDSASRSEALATAYDATQHALSRLEITTPLEKALILALRARYPYRNPIDDMRPWNHDFAIEMRKIHATFPDFPDACALFADALLNLTPWKMWNLKTAKPADGAATHECQRILEQAMASLPQAMTHPGILHFYVHLMEMSPHPEKALMAGDTLRTLCPDAGHLVHMATHIDVLCGQYRDAVFWNQCANKADQKYLDREGARNLYTGYRLHNYHFVIYGAMLLGQLRPALEAVRGIIDTTPIDILRTESPPMADYFESYFAMEPHVLIRFGQWRQLTQMPLPDDPTLFRTLTANTYYGRGMAFAALGDIEAAENEEQLFLSARDDVPESRLLHNNKVCDLLEIATDTLRGEICYRKGDFDLAFSCLRRAVEKEDNLRYDEPWGWMQPSRHALGALLLEQGSIDEAEAVFREDLGYAGNLSRATIHPDNVWSLRGLYDCLTARGISSEQDQVKYRLDLALARSDHNITSSCYCSQVAMQASSQDSGHL